MSFRNVHEHILFELDIINATSVALTSKRFNSNSYIVAASDLQQSARERIFEIAKRINVTVDELITLYKERYELNKIENARRAKENRLLKAERQANAILAHELRDKFTAQLCAA